MATDQIKIDEDGVPVLQEPLSQDEQPAAESPPSVDLTDHEQIDRLLQRQDIQDLLGDLTEDLQKMMSWKMESFLKEEFNRLIREAAEQSAPRLAEDIRTQLQLALPNLLAQINEKARD